MCTAHFMVLVTYVIGPRATNQEVSRQRWRAKGQAAYAVIGWGRHFNILHQQDIEGFREKQHRA